MKQVNLMSSSILGEHSSNKDIIRYHEKREKKSTNKGYHFLWNWGIMIIQKYIPEQYFCDIHPTGWSKVLWTPFQQLDCFRNM